MARPPRKKRAQLSGRELRKRIRGICDELAVLGSAWDLSNGRLRYQVRLLERELRKLARQLKD